MTVLVLIACLVLLTMGKKGFVVVLFFEMGFLCVTLEPFLEREEQYILPRVCREESRGGVGG